MALTDEEAATVKRLTRQLEGESLYVSLNDAYYEGEQRLIQLGLAVPPELQKFVTIVNPAVDRKNGTFKVTLEVADRSGDLRPGSFARVRLEAANYADVIFSVNNYMRFMCLEVYVTQKGFLTGYDPDETTFPPTFKALPVNIEIDPRNMAVYRVFTNGTEFTRGVPGLDTLLDKNGAPPAPPIVIDAGTDASDTTDAASDG